MPVQKIDVLAIGKVAREALARPQSARVLGKTSRGMFLLLPSGWVIFLSLEAHCGPLSLNLRDDQAALHRPEVGSTARCSPDRIDLTGIRIDLPGPATSPWQAPALPAASPSPQIIRDRLLAVAHRVGQSGASGQLIPWLAHWLASQPLPDVRNNPFGPHLDRLRSACRTGRSPEIAAALKPFLGLGPGLTPSGDDLVAGFLLAANRWGERLLPALDRAALNHGIRTPARKATSALSASLIECATLGQADERLILALDGIVAGSLAADACFTALSAWGSSSGFDALVGMAVFLLL